MNPAVTDLLTYNLRKHITTSPLLLMARGLTTGRGIQTRLDLLDLMILKWTALTWCRELRQIQQCAGHHDHGTRARRSTGQSGSKSAPMITSPNHQRARTYGADLKPCCVAYKVITRDRSDHNRKGNLRMDMERPFGHRRGHNRELTRLEFDLLHRLPDQPGACPDA